MKIRITESQLVRVLKEQRGGSNKLSQNEFIKRAQETHNKNGVPKYDYSLVDYVNSGTKVKIICPKHKEDWLNTTGNEYFEIFPNKHLDGQGCRFDYLESKQKYSNKDLENEALKYNTTAEFKKNSPSFYYAAVKNPEFFQKITSHFVPEKESSGEKFVAEILINKGLIDENCGKSNKNCKNREKIFQDCRNLKSGRYCLPLKFDFYIPELNTIVEYDGEQHFRPSTKFGLDKFMTTKENDRIKNEYCKKNNINLIRIHYKVPFEKIKKELPLALENPEPLILIGNYELNSESLNESFKKTDTFPSFIRHQLELIYKPLGLWGKAPNPNDDCETHIGVLDVFPHSKSDTWSILNRFDTNSKVKNKIHQIFLESNPTDSSSKGFENWIIENRTDLFGIDGKYTQELVDLNLNTVESGNRNEEFAVSKLSEKFPNTKIKRYCSGDVRDTKKGIDITVEHPTKPFNVQVKPFIRVGSYFEPDGDTFFEVTSYLDVNKYSEKNVDVFMFVDSQKGDFILFKNKKNKIGQMRNNIIRFYEPPLYTNMTFITKEKRKMKNFDDTDQIFGLETNLEKNLEFRKQQIDKLLDKMKNKLK